MRVLGSTIFLVFLIVLAAARVEPNGVSDHLAEKNCSARCERLFDRSLKRVGFSLDKVSEAIRTANAQDASVVCWKFLDYDDCERQCREDDHSPAGKRRAALGRKCKKFTASSQYLQQFQCLHRYHTFLEVRCQSFAREATRYRVLSKLAKADDELGNSRLPPAAQNATREMLIHETCRFLHYHGMCLANAVFAHCPQADDLFNRFTLRDYFLSFVVPKRDQLFTDRLLDYCQLYDFQKIARDLFDSTKSTVKRHSGDEAEVTRSGIFLTRPHTPPPSVTGGPNERSTGKKSLFSSDEDLLDTPPNFYYSSAKYTKSYREALERLNYQTTLHGQTIDGLDLITQPADRAGEWTTDEDGKQVRRTTIPIQKTTSPDAHPTDSPDHRFWSARGGRYEMEEFGSEGAEEPEEGGEYVDYIDLNGPLFRDPPHVFKIRKYDEPGSDFDQRHQGLVFGHREPVSPPPISVTVHHVDEDGNPAEEVDYEANGGDSEEDFDPNEITFPGRRNREETTRRARTERPPSVHDVFRTFVSTALHPTTPQSSGDGRAAQNVLLLLIAYSAFFTAALLILVALIVVFVVRRRRAERYATYLVKKPPK